MLLLLARHGNTFEHDAKVVWVGARTDIPLTAKGRDQAAELGAALAPASDRIKRIISGPLKRTREHAIIAARELRFEKPIEIDERLREIDYGLWEGKSSEEIQALGGGSELKIWNEQGAWPKTPGWTPSDRTISENVTRISNGLAVRLTEGDAALLVTSNGILKFFLKLVPGAFEGAAATGALKVSTGNCCGLRHEDSRWRIVFWNRRPSQVREEL
jgi:broad specificity phosphatase PhoE